MTSQTIQHDCKRELRGVKLKATPARLAVLKVLEEANQPLDVATIKAAVKKMGSILILPQCFV